MKTVTHHRVLTYLLQNRVINSYAKMMKKDFRNADLITGQNGWCDFLSKDEWGEIGLVFQDDLLVPILRRAMFTFDVKEIETRFSIQVDPKSIPTSQQERVDLPLFRMDTQSALRDELEKKLKKTYQYQQKGFLDQGCLILSVFDPSFGGFDNDLEIRCNALDLEALRTIAKNFSSTSSFRKVLLVDGLVPFEENPHRHTYELLP